MDLTLQNFFTNFRPFADSNTAYQFAKKLFAAYLNTKDKYLWWVENGKIVFDKYNFTGSLDFDRDGVHDSGLRTPELWQPYSNSEFFIRWRWYLPD